MLIKKELEKMSDLEFAAIVLQEKLDKLTNPNTPTAAKLRCTINHLREMDRQEKTRCKSWWYIQYYGEDGERLLPQEISEYELDRIGTNVRHGFGSGELVAPTGGEDE